MEVDLAATEAGSVPWPGNVEVETRRPRSQHTVMARAAAPSARRAEAPPVIADYDDAMDEDGSNYESDASGSSAFDEYEPDEGPAPPPATAPEDDELADIEQEDFTRLIHAFQETPASKQAPTSRRNAWKQSMEAEMESFHHELRDVNGYARKNKVRSKTC